MLQSVNSSKKRIRNGILMLLSVNSSKTRIFWEQDIDATEYEHQQDKDQEQDTDATECEQQQDKDQEQNTDAEFDSSKTRMSGIEY